MTGSRSRAWYAAIAAAFFLIAFNLGYVMRLLGLRQILGQTALLTLHGVLQVTLCLIGVAVAHRCSFRDSLRELGLLAPVGRGLAFATLASLPMLVTYAAMLPVSPQLSVSGLFLGCLLAPFVEEVLYRGYLFRQLYRRARLGFWLAALLPSVVFALAHRYQSNDTSELLGILAITGSGGLLFSWVFMKWQDNLWAAIGLHAMMNLWWDVFAVDDTALGSHAANVARLLTIVLAVLLTLYKDRIWKPLPAETANIAHVT